MTEFLIETIRLVAGVSLGILAIYIAVITLRVVAHNQDAYNTNRSITPASPLAVWKGNLNAGVDGEKRASHGLAFELKSGQLREQKRLSTEAIDDVIGRRT